MTKRRARELAAPGVTKYAQAKLLSKWKAQGRACIYCGRTANSVDHVIPLVRGGSNREATSRRVVGRATAVRVGGPLRSGA